MRQITSTIAATPRLAKTRLAAVRLIGLLIAVAAANPSLRAQDSTVTPGPAAQSGKTVSDSSSSKLARFLQYPWNGFSVWAGGAYETRTASHNEHFAGSMRIVGVQISRDVWRGQRTRISYLGEVLPIMLVHSGPPVNRIPDTLASIVYTQKELDRFKFREGYGFGLAPFGAEVTVQTSPRTSALFNITAGGLIFTQVIPYGAATKANFTVSPGVAFQWEPQNRTRVGVGYTFHHLSNASFGRVNPGMNSQVIYIRLSRMRQPPSNR